MYLLDSLLQEIMGCFLSCCGGDEEDREQEGDRTRLLSECGSQIQVPSGFNEDLHCKPPISSSLPRQNDESSKLTQILTDFAEEIIDISDIYCDDELKLSMEFDSNMQLFTTEEEEDQELAFSNIQRVPEGKTP